MCNFLNCKKRAIYNVQNELPLYCSEHRLIGMVNAKSKKCLKCNKLPSFGYANDNKAIYCSIHKKEERRNN